MLEHLVRTWCLEEEKLYVVTGPIFQNNKGKIGLNQVTVPGYYYKVIYDPTDNPKMIGFIMPNEKLTNSIVSYAVKVDEIEKMTGIDFFSQLEDATENLLESANNADEWNFTISSFKNSSNKSNSTSGTSVQCKGIAKSTGVRCKKKTSNANSYCHYHQSQSEN